MSRYLPKLLLITYTGFTAYSLFLIGTGRPFLEWLTPFATFIGFAFAVVHGGLSIGWRRVIILLLACFIVSMAMESYGVSTGQIYGPYHYTDRLGPKFIGLVPYIIPVAWFMMLYPSLVIALSVIRWFPSGLLNAVLIAAIGAVVMTAWDLVMDPVMVQSGHWVWDGPTGTRPYFGIPPQNFTGWWLTVFLTLMIFLLFSGVPSLSRDRKPAANEAVILYAICGTSTIISAVLMGLTGPALVGVFTMLPWILVGFKDSGILNRGSMKRAWFQK